LMRGVLRVYQKTSVLPESAIWAASMGHLRLVKWLAQRVNRLPFKTMFKKAIRAHQLAVAEWIVDMGREVNIKAAVKAGSQAMYDRIRERDRARDEDEDEGENYELAVLAASRGHVELALSIHDDDRIRLRAGIARGDYNSWTEGKASACIEEWHSEDLWICVANSPSPPSFITWIRKSDRRSDHLLPSDHCFIWYFQTLLKRGKLNVLEILDQMTSVPDSALQKALRSHKVSDTSFERLVQNAYGRWRQVAFEYLGTMPQLYTTGRLKRLDDVFRILYVETYEAASRDVQGMENEMAFRILAIAHRWNGYSYDEATDNALAWHLAVKCGSLDMLRWLAQISKREIPTNICSTALKHRQWDLIPWILDRTHANAYVDSADVVVLHALHQYAKSNVL